MVKIGELNFGSIEIEGKKYRKDVLIFADARVKKRKGDFLMLGGHEIKKQGLEELSQGQSEVVIVGTGTDGAAHVAAEAESWPRVDNVNLLVRPSYEAVAKLHELVGQRKKVPALIHITC